MRKQSRFGAKACLRKPNRRLFNTQCSRLHCLSETFSEDDTNPKLEDSRQADSHKQTPDETESYKAATSDQSGTGQEEKPIVSIAKYVTRARIRKHAVAPISHTKSNIKTSLEAGKAVLGRGTAAELGLGAKNSSPQKLKIKYFLVRGIENARESRQVAVALATTSIRSGSGSHSSIGQHRSAGRTSQFPDTSRTGNGSPKVYACPRSSRDIGFWPPSFPDEKTDKQPDVEEPWGSLAFRDHVKWTPDNNGSSNSSSPDRKFNTGVSLSSAGLLKVHDTTLASEKLHTVLFLSAASTNLHPIDFYRLNPPGTHLPTFRSLGGLLKVVPGYNPESLARFPYWILVFSSPLAAHTYQTRFLESYELAAKHAANLPDLPSPQNHNGNDSANNTSSTTTDEATHQRIREFTLLPPFPSQSLSPPRPSPLTALLPPFPLHIDYPLLRHHLLTLPDTHARRSFPLRVSATPRAHFTLTSQILQESIDADGKARGLQWDVYPKLESVVEMEERVKRGLRGEGGWRVGWGVNVNVEGGGGRRGASSSVAGGDDEGSGDGDVNADADIGTGGVGDGDGDAGGGGAGAGGWIVRCRSETEALRFKRAWDRRVLRKTAFSAVWPDPPPEVRVEVLW